MGWSEQVERNLKAIEYEKNGKIEEAIQLYEENVAEKFNGTYPYKRLSELYQELDRKEDLLRVLERAIEVFKDARLSDCTDQYVQLEQFKQAHLDVTQTLGEAN